MDIASPQQLVPRIYTLIDIEKVTCLPSFQGALIEAISNGFVGFAQNRFFTAPIQTMGAPPMAAFDADEREEYAAQTCVKSGYFKGNPYYVIKGEFVISVESLFLPGLGYSSWKPVLSLLLLLRETIGTFQAAQIFCSYLLLSCKWWLPV
jgi:hypothetical protein